MDLQGGKEEEGKHVQVIRSITAATLDVHASHHLHQKLDPSHIGRVLDGENQQSHPHDSYYHDPNGREMHMTKQAVLEQHGVVKMNGTSEQKK